jgi:beta-alanine degradation protein BauB
MSPLAMLIAYLPTLGQIIIPTMTRILLSTAAALVTLSCNTSAPTPSSKTDTAVIAKSTPAVQEPDELVASPENYKLLFENEHVQVLEYSLEPGKKDQWHTHPPKSSYVVSGGLLKVYLEDGKTKEAQETAGTASWDGAVGRHQVENIGTTPVKIILTEAK